MRVPARSSRLSHQLATLFFVVVASCSSSPSNRDICVAACEANSVFQEQLQQCLEDNNCLGERQTPIDTSETGVTVASISVDFDPNTNTLVEVVRVDPESTAKKPALLQSYLEARATSGE